MMSRRLRRIVLSRPLTAAALLAATVVTGGCWTEGGRGYSNDSYTYISREWEPKTISVIDTRTGQAVWSYEIPVGRQLMMEFFAKAGTEPGMPDQLKWSDYPAGQAFGSLDHSVSVPSASVRRVDMKLRPVPESEKIEPKPALSNGQ